MNISIAIADTNMEYVERLAEVLQQYEELTIHIYSSGTKLQTAMETKQFDIVLFDPDISEEKMGFPRVKYPVCLYSDEARNRSWYADFDKVLKYQRISNIYKTLVREYADRAGYVADFDHSQNTNIIAVYSPIGGSGKTTVALAIAGKLASMGKSVLFISMEQLNSSFYVNPKREEGITALVEGAADEKTSFELKVKGIMKQGMNGMLYIEGFEKLVDYDAVSGKEIADVLDRIRRCGVCDFIVTDMESSLDEIGKAVMEAAVHIVVVEKPGELSNVKMELFAQQAIMNECKSKMLKIHTFAENQSKYFSESDIPVVGNIHNYGNLPLKNVIQAINGNNEIKMDRFLKG